MSEFEHFDGVFIWRYVTPSKLEEIRKYMETTRWYYGIGADKHIPTTEELLRVFNSVVQGFYQSPIGSLQSGGFVAKLENGRVRVDFAHPDSQFLLDQ